MRRLGWFGLGLVALATFFGGGWLLRRGLEARGQAGAMAGEAPTVTNRLFQEVVRHVRTYAVDSLDEQTIYRRAASGMLEELDDPYALIVPGSRLEGPAPYRPVSLFGMYLDLESGIVSVVAVVEGSPADLAGVRGGDALIEIDGTSTEGLRPEEVAARVASTTGEVRVRVAREGVLPLRITIDASSAQAPPQPAPGAVVSRVAHVRVPTLSGSAASAAAGMIETAVKDGAKALVLDLRGAVEGDLADAVAVAGLFLPRGATVVVTRGREPADSAVLAVSRAPRFPDLPVVVLVDRGTAGAAEAVAGALQDHDRALVVGEPSFGRGASVSYFPLGDGSSLRLTTALWHTATGRVLQRPGVPETVPDEGDEKRGRPEFRTASNRLVWGGGGVVPDREVASAGGDRPAGDRDPALTLARRLLAGAPSTRVLLSLESP